MKKELVFNKKGIYIEIFVHSIIWIYGTFLISTGRIIRLDYLDKMDVSILLPVLIGTAFNILIFYTTAFLLMPEYLGKQHVKKFWVWLLLLVAGLSILEASTDYFLSYLSSEKSAGLISSGGILSVFLLHLFFVALAFIYRTGRDWFRNEKIKHQLTEDKLSAELNFLRAQINPHFLFNTLNNLYSLALGSKPETADGIAKLSHLMRYMIYDSKTEKVSLEKEINYLKDYTDLQRLRSAATEDESEIVIHFETYIENSMLQIAPMLLIPIVENSFKHGISVVEKSEITIVIRASNNYLQLNVRNTIPNKKNISEGGLGLQNLKRRLELLYPERFKLTTKSETNMFFTHFKLNLANDHKSYSD